MSDWFFDFQDTVNTPATPSEPPNPLNWSDEPSLKDQLTALTQPPPNDLLDLLELLDAGSKPSGDLLQFSYYDSEFPGGGGDGPGTGGGGGDDPGTGGGGSDGEQPYVPPTGLPDDYSDLSDLGISLIDWLEWLDGNGPAQSDYDGWDSLEPYMHGEWHFDIDPELINGGQFGGVYVDGNSPWVFRPNSQYGTAQNIGLMGPNGTIIPIFRQWTEITEFDDGDPNTVNDLVVSVHTEFFGVRRVSSATTQDPSLIDQLIGQLRGVGALVEGLGFVQMAANIFDMATTPDDNDAIRNAQFDAATGVGSATVVSQDGVFIGTIQLDEYGYRMYNRSGQLIGSFEPLEQLWDSEQGVSHQHDLISRESRFGVNFASFLIDLSTMGGFRFGHGDAMRYFSDLGFGIGVQILSGLSLEQGRVLARMQEAAYELRWQILQRR